MTSYEDQLAGISETFVTDYQNRDPVACARAYTEDGVVMEAGAPTAVGHKEISALLKASMDAGVEVTNIITTSATAYGSIGYALQTVETNHGRGRVLLAMRRDANDRWLVAVEAFCREQIGLQLKKGKR